MTPYITPMKGRRVRLNVEGQQISPRYAGRDGMISGESRNREAWLVKFEGIKYPIGFHKSFVEIINERDSMNTADVNGRPWAKLSELCEGDSISLDAGFTCAEAGEKTVKRDNDRLYFDCHEGRHYIDGQADDGEHCVGVYPQKSE